MHRAVSLSATLGHNGGRVKLLLRVIAMPVVMGVLCGKCRTVNFISPSGKSAHFRFERARGEFKLTCNPPCHSVT